MKNLESNCDSRSQLNWIVRCLKIPTPCHAIKTSFCRLIHRTDPAVISRKLAYVFNVTKYLEIVIDLIPEHS